jgi:hypothetical protein
MNGSPGLEVESCLPTPDGLQIVLVGPAATEFAVSVTVTDIFGATVQASVEPQAETTTNAGFAKVLVRASVRPTDPASDSPSYLLTISIDSQPISFWVAPSRPSALAIQAAAADPSPDGLGQVDYTGRDYDALRAMMRARIAQSVEDNSAWALDHLADPLTTLVEVLAYAGDHLSFRQDAAGTESYLTTARRRLSLRRHARLRDYGVNDGCNARTVVAFTVNGDGVLPAGLAAVTLQPSLSGVVLAQDVTLAASTTVYETMEMLSVATTLNDLGEKLAQGVAYTVPAGTITLTLQGSISSLLPGRLLVLSQTLAPSGVAAPFGAQALRLLVVTPSTGNDGTATTEITWHPEDALAKPLTIPPSSAQGAVSLFANVVLADHGQTVTAMAPKPSTVPATGEYRPIVTVDDPVSAAPPPVIAAGFNGTQDVVSASLLVPSAKASLNPDPTTAVIALQMIGCRQSMPGTTDTWMPQLDLLTAPATGRMFAVVPEQGVGSAPRKLAIRFGDGAFGYPPAPGTVFSATVRSADGQSGRLQPNSLVQVIAPAPLVTGVCNPLPATNTPAEQDQAIRLFATSGFRTQRRGIEPLDWDQLGGSDPLVSEVTASYGPNGSGPCTVGLTTTAPEAVSFPVASRRLLDYAILGAPPQIQRGTDVTVNIALVVYCKPGTNIRAARERLLRRMGTGLLPDGTPAYFNPVNWPLGRGLILTDVVAALVADAAVAFVIAQQQVDTRVLFETNDRPGSTADNLISGEIPVAAAQRIRVTNDPFKPEAGTMGLVVVASP